MDWQQLAALGIVVAAFLWLLRTQVFPGGKHGGCGSCGGCATNTPAPPSLIAAEELMVLPSARASASGEGAEKVVKRTLPSHHGDHRAS